MQNERNSPDFPVTASPFDFRTEFDLEKLKVLFDEKKMSRQKLSELSGVEYSALCRFFSGDSKNPSFMNVVSIIRALGGSVDEFVGIKKTAEAPPPAAPERPQNVDFYERVFADMRLQFDTQISRLEDKHRLRVQEIADRANEIEKSRHRTFVALIVISVVLFAILFLSIGVLAYDLTHLDRGWFQMMFSGANGLFSKIASVFTA